MGEALDYLLSINATIQQTHDRCTAAAMATAAVAVNKAQDAQYGGFYELRTADGNISTSKVWWVQADAMLALYKLHRYFDAVGRNTTTATAVAAGTAGNAARLDYLQLLADTARFVRQYQTDNEVAGEQFWQVRTVADGPGLFWESACARQGTGMQHMTCAGATRLTLSVILWQYSSSVSGSNPHPVWLLQGAVFAQVSPNGTYVETTDVDKGTKGNHWKASWHTTKAPLYLLRWIRQDEQQQP